MASALFYFDAGPVIETLVALLIIIDDIPSYLINPAGGENSAADGGSNCTFTNSSTAVLGGTPMLTWIGKLCRSGAVHTSNFCSVPVASVTDHSVFSQAWSLIVSLPSNVLP